MLTVGPARVLGPANGDEVARVLASDPIAACLVAARFEQAGMDPRALGGQFWGVGGGRDGVCFDGPNLVPLSGDKHSLKAFAQAASRSGRRCASILGPAELVLPLWDRCPGVGVRPGRCAPINPCWPARSARRASPIR